MSLPPGAPTPVGFVSLFFLFCRRLSTRTPWLLRLSCCPSSSQGSTRTHVTVWLRLSLFFVVSPLACCRLLSGSHFCPSACDLLRFRRSERHLLSSRVSFVIWGCGWGDGVRVLVFDRLRLDERVMVARIAFTAAGAACSARGLLDSSP